jgi:hypothetical protein
MAHSRRATPITTSALGGRADLLLWRGSPGNQSGSSKQDKRLSLDPHNPQASRGSNSLTKSGPPLAEHIGPHNGVHRCNLTY